MVIVDKSGSTGMKWIANYFLITLSAVLLVLPFADSALSADDAGKYDRESYSVRIRPNQPIQKVTANTGAPILSLSAMDPGDTCSAFRGGEPWWLVSGWLIGEESYYAYQNPDLVCPGAYPFTIQEAHFTLLFSPSDTSIKTIDIPMVLEIMSVDTTNPGCPKPGSTIISGSPGTVTLPAPNLYDITIPLDIPLEVMQPYFVRVIFTEAVPQNWGLQLVTDSIQALCDNYNLWDTAVGYVDMGDDHAIRQEAYPSNHCCFNGPPDPPGCNNCFDFDGRLILYTFGTLGGFPPQPAPQVAIVGPRENDKLFGTVDIWAAETSGNDAIDSAVFAYKTNGAWMRIGVDTDTTLALSAPSTPPLGPGDGLSYHWNFSALPEGTCWIRVQVYDSLGQSASDSVFVSLEPTPPVPSLQSPPNYGDRFCNPVTLTYTFTDENPSTVVYYKKTAQVEHTKSLQTINQFTLGDADGNPADGNPASQGEFGDYYGGPAVGALLLRYWAQNGFPQSITIGGTQLTNPEIAEQLASYMKVRTNRGLDAENFVMGFRNYLSIFGFGQLELEFHRIPSYAQVRNWSEEVGSAVALGVAGIPGEWLAVDGFSGRRNLDGTFKLRVSDPYDGIKKLLPWRDVSGAGEVLYNGTWRKVKIMIRVTPSTWTVTGRQGIGFAMASGSPLNFNLSGGGASLVDGNLYFITAELSDGSANTGYHTVLLDYTCTAFKLGDYDGNGISNIGDMVYLIQYVLAGGPAPLGGGGRADTDCSSTVETADVIYYMNWMFSGGPTPCY